MSKTNISHLKENYIKIFCFCSALILSILFLSFTIPAIQANADSDAVCNNIENDTTVDVNTFNDLKNSLNNALQNQSIYIKLNADIDFPQSAITKPEDLLVVNSFRKITIDLNSHKIDRKLNDFVQYGNIFIIAPNGRLIITDSTDDNGEICNGKNTSQAGAILVNPGGFLDIKGGSITNNESNVQGGAICNYGKCTISGDAIIDSNKSPNGAGIYSKKLKDSPSTEDAKLVISGKAKISNNQSNVGGGIFIDTDVNSNGLSELNLSGNATISDNYAKDGGAGVFCKGNFTMNGGSINNNTTDKQGAGVYVHGHISSIKYPTSCNTHFTMTGGTIKSNTAKERGGGVFVDYYNMDMIMTGGTISNNKCGTKGGGIYASQPITIGGSAQVINNELSSVSQNAESANNLYFSLKDVENPTKQYLILAEPDNNMKVGLTLELENGTFLDESISGLEDKFFADNTSTTFLAYNTLGEFEYVNRIMLRQAQANAIEQIKSQSSQYAPQSVVSIVDSYIGKINAAVTTTDVDILVKSFNNEISGIQKIDSQANFVSQQAYNPVQTSDWALQIVLIIVFALSTFVWFCKNL